MVLGDQLAITDTYHIMLTTKSESSCRLLGADIKAHQRVGLDPDVARVAQDHLLLMAAAGGC